MDRVDAILIERDGDPMGVLQGKLSPYQIGPDIAGMSAVLHPAAPPFHTVSVNFQTYPEVGEVVFAVGYPELDFKTLNGSDIARYLKEGMYGVYGQVIGLHPDGRGSRPSPGFEVEADWPSGMSGGPVFNQRGEVIGVVSSSLPPSDMEPGIGYATSFAMTPNISMLAATLDVGNPGRRLGFGVFRTDPFHLAGVFKSLGDAEHLRAQLPPGYLVSWGSHRLGSNDFVIK